MSALITEVLYATETLVFVLILLVVITAPARMDGC